MTPKEEKVRKIGIILCFITMCAMRILNWNTLPSFFKLGTVLLTLFLVFKFIFWIIERVKIAITLKDLITEELEYLNSALQAYSDKEKKQRITFNDELRFVIDICECDIEEAKELRKAALSKRKKEKLENFINEAEHILKQLNTIKKRDSI